MLMSVPVGRRWAEMEGRVRMSELLRRAVWEGLQLLSASYSAEVGGVEEGIRTQQDAVMARGSQGGAEGERGSSAII